MMHVSECQALKPLVTGIADATEWVDVCVNGLTLDSRAVQPGNLFLALPGGSSDGRRYIGEAVAAGAGAVLVEAPCDDIDEYDAAVYEVTNLRRFAGSIADRFYSRPSQKLCVIGITGTNGKTTCSHLLAQALEQLGVQAGVLGTLGNGRLDSLQPSGLTTGDVVGVHREIRRLLDDNVSFVCMEVSSHALDQGRVDKVAFDVAVFTNLSRDHLDYHVDMASYGNAKQRLFGSPELSASVVNVDDDFGRQIATRTDRDKLWSHGVARDARVRCASLEESSSGSELTVAWDGKTTRLRVPLIGRFNADNVLAVFTVLLALGFSTEKISKVIAGLKPVAGRMEVFTRPGRPKVVVDYAHTPDALEKILLACRRITRGKLWLVFGCGGERDRDKRPLMGGIATRLADQVVVTNDNPRGEAERAIIRQICAAMDGSETVLTDRSRAIDHAISNAKVIDTVVIAGKGHETGQIIGRRTLPFSDRECVLSILGGDV